MAANVERLTRGLRAAAREGADAGVLGEEISRMVSRVVAHDAVNLVAASPATSRSHWSFGFSHGYEPDFGRALMRRYYARDDPYLPEDLLKRPVPAGVLGTGGGRRDRMARQLLSTHGVGSALRLLLRDSRGVWGVLGLLRAEGGRPFDDQDGRRAARLAPTLMALLRDYVCAGPLAPAGPVPLPGVFIVGADHAVRAATPQARAWTGQLHVRARVPDWIGESVVIGLAIQANRHARDRNAAPALLVGPPATYGRWIAMHGQPLDGGAAGEVAVVVQAATGGLLLPSFCDWYGLTDRERQVVGYLCGGAAPKQIAGALNLSRHTVNDHLKAIYRKAGAAGRDELIAALVV